jgi:Tfp pilus assembly protein PilF
LLTGPLASRDPDLALAMSRRSVELEGNNSLYLNTYGLALCRCRRFAEAVPILERSLAAAAGKTDGFDLLFLAIAHHHLGHPSLAGDCLKRALHWRAENHALPGRWKAEFDEFEAEARALLQPPASTLPAIVFAPE